MLILQSRQPRLSRFPRITQLARGRAGIQSLGLSVWTMASQFRNNPLSFPLFLFFFSTVDGQIIPDISCTNTPYNIDKHQYLVKWNWTRTMGNCGGQTDRTAGAGIKRGHYSDYPENQEVTVHQTNQNSLTSLLADIVLQRPPSVHGPCCPGWSSPIHQELFRPQRLL